MDELPRNAKKLLGDARGSHEPPRGAQQRVWTRLEASSFGGVAAPGKLGHPTAAGKTAKMALASGVIALLGGASYWLGGETRPRAVTRPPTPIVTARRDEAPVVETKPAEAPEEVSRAPHTAPSRTAEPQRASRAPTAARKADGALMDEMSLLSAASDALAAQDVARAAELLDTYRARYPHGQLREERAGLEILRRCLLVGRAASAQAERYVRDAPRGMLRARIEKACKL